MHDGPRVVQVAAFVAVGAALVVAAYQRRLLIAAPLAVAFGIELARLAAALGVVDTRG